MYTLYGLTLTDKYAPKVIKCCVSSWCTRCIMILQTYIPSVNKNMSLGDLQHEYSFAVYSTSWSSLVEVTS